MYNCRKVVRFESSPPPLPFFFCLPFVCHLSDALSNTNWGGHNTVFVFTPTTSFFLLSAICLPFV